jgi:hypothetical protein
MTINLKDIEAKLDLALMTETLDTLNTLMKRYKKPNIKKFNLILNAAIWNRYFQDVLYSKLYAASNQSETMYSRGRLKRLFKTLEKLSRNQRHQSWWISGPVGACPVGTKTQMLWPPTENSKEKTSQFGVFHSIKPESPG